MKIQVLAINNNRQYTSKYDIVYSSFDKPKTLDEFDINIIDFNNAQVWRNKADSYRSINCAKELRDIKTLIDDSVSSKVIVLIPQNHDFEYYNYSNHYNRTIKLKDILTYVVSDILDIIVASKSYTLVYENAVTLCENIQMSSCFYIKHPSAPVITETEYGKKATSVKISDKMYISSLNVEKEHIDSFLKMLGFDDKQTEEIPDWLNEVKILDDDEKIEEIKHCASIIDEMKLKIDRANAVLDKNMFYKKALVSTGDKLVEIVFSMLQELLCCNLNNFIDEKKEDFLIRKENVTFIGEVKGVTSNVRSEHISQTERHAQSYLDKLQDANISENVKAILIINHSRKLNLSERKEIHENQVSLAKKYGLLIITSDIILKLYEKYKQNTITTEEIISMFKDKTGVLNITDF